jgi:hypothetical protein
MRENVSSVVEALIMELDLLDVPSKATVREARAALTVAKISATAINLQAAVRVRKQRRYTLDTGVELPPLDTDD